MSNGYLAIDLGPSRLTAGVLDADGEVVVRDRLTTPARNVWPALTNLVSRVLAANQSDVQPTACGVTCPGPIDRLTGAMKPVGLPMWHDFPLRRELHEVTGLPVTVETTGRGLALAELWCGRSAALPAADQQFATLVLGDDVDGALVVDGRLAEGLTGNLGQFGHLIVEPEGTDCACGAQGCLTTYAGIRGIEASTGRELRRTPPAIVERTGIMAARGCATLAALLDVSEIVIGGPVASVFAEPFFEALSKELDQRSGLDHLADLRVRGTENGRVGPLVAAAAVARHAAVLEGGEVPPAPVARPNVTAPVAVPTTPAVTTLPRGEPFGDGPAGDVRIIPIEPDDSTGDVRIVPARDDGAGGPGGRSATT